MARHYDSAEPFYNACISVVLWAPRPRPTPGLRRRSFVRAVQVPLRRRHPAMPDPVPERDGPLASASRVHGLRTPLRHGSGRDDPVRLRANDDRAGQLLRLVARVRGDDNDPSRCSLTHAAQMTATPATNPQTHAKTPRQKQNACAPGLGIGQQPSLHLPSGSGKKRRAGRSTPSGEGEARKGRHPPIQRS